jgi:hypothetical protein
VIVVDESIEDIVIELKEIVFCGFTSKIEHYLFVELEDAVV